MNQPGALFAPVDWLPDMDLNHDKQIQSLLCYRYTIGQANAVYRLKAFAAQSSTGEEPSRPILTGRAALFPPRRDRTRAACPCRQPIAEI